MGAEPGAGSRDGEDVTAGARLAPAGEGLFELGPGFDKGLCGTLVVKEVREAVKGGDEPVSFLLAQSW
jgi:hypothetical protein